VKIWGWEGAAELREKDKDGEMINSVWQNQSFMIVIA
jgi:hypothetical protein